MRKVQPAPANRIPKSFILSMYRKESLKDYHHELTRNFKSLQDAVTYFYNQASYLMSWESTYQEMKGIITDDWGNTISTIRRVRSAYDVPSAF